ncbi:interleukin-17C-like [Thunnus maccoyii]|uniref:interleukin-17C-like n=1 Tax=Thunnus maccoyii TaxID=8240 RepID=UPI001C4D49D6|nr:interleukin-17C-like [Thunnus maccoyii]
MKAFNNGVGNFWRLYWNKLSVSKNLLSLQSTRTCEQVAKEMHGEQNNRALSPWEYSIDRDDSRFPHEIAVAKCLCKGCIINRRENHSYNSVPVRAPLTVLMKTPCPSDPDKYVLRKNVIVIYVACTCVSPM